MQTHETTLACRLGKTEHVSPLRFRIAALAAQYPAPNAACLEDWLVDVANARGARVVSRQSQQLNALGAPSSRDFPDEELVVSMCQLQCADRPQMLRLAAQIISRGQLRMTMLLNLARRERAAVVLAELARLALRVDPHHAAWKTILDAFAKERPPAEPLLHWTRLAEPVMRDGRCDAAGWRLVA